MTEIALLRYPIQDGKKNIWIRWCEKVRKRENEVLDTLHEEGMLTEACFIDPEEIFFYIFVRSNKLENAYKAEQTSIHEIDKENKQNRLLSLLAPEQLKKLFYFKNSKD